jgi:hypothetical protein
MLHSIAIVNAEYCWAEILRIVRLILDEINSSVVLIMSERIRICFGQFVLCF